MQPVPSAGKHGAGDAKHWACVPLACAGNWAIGAKRGESVCTTDVKHGKITPIGLELT